MINIISAAVVGVLAGILARYFYPGAVQMSMLWTMVLGIAGSLLAGLVASRGATGFHRGGFIASIVGAMLLIFVGRMLNLG